MLDPTDLRLLYQLRPAESGDFPFAEALTHGNMGAYYKRHGLVWRSDLFYASWRESENFILEADGERIGVLRVTEEGDSLHIRDVQIAAGHRGQGAGTYMLDMSHRWARARGLHELQLRVFVDNPARPPLSAHGLSRHRAAPGAARLDPAHGTRGLSARTRHTVRVTRSCRAHRGRRCRPRHHLRPARGLPCRDARSRAA